MQSLKKVDIILSEEIRSYEANGRKIGGLGTFNVGTQSIWKREGKIPKLISNNPSTNNIQSTNANLLIKLVSKTSGDERDQLIEYLFTYLSTESEFKQASYLIFFVLYRFGKISEALEVALKANIEQNNIAFNNISIIFQKVLFFEWHLIKENNL